MSPRNNAGLTWIEALVCLAVIGVLAALAMPAITAGPVKAGRMTQTLSNMRQLHLATMQRAQDGISSGTNVGWPGDMGGAFSNWAGQLVPAYLSTNDFCKLLSAPGVVVRPGKIPAMAEGAVLVYTVKADSKEDTVFLSSANFTNTPTGGERPNKKAKPYGDKGFVLFRKAGDGAILMPKQTGLAYTNIIGSYVPLCR